jgi:putative N6-adenine-specific DNA methylase
MADAFAPLTTWSIYVLTSHPGFERHFRRRADRRRKMYAGRLECHYFQYYGPRPPGEEPPDGEATSLSDPSSTEAATVSENAPRVVDSNPSGEAAT